MRSRFLYRAIISLLIISTLTCNLVMVGFLQRFFYGDLQVEDPATLHRLVSSLGTRGQLAHNDYKDVVESTDAFNVISANFIEPGLAVIANERPIWSSVSWTSGSFGKLIGTNPATAGRFLQESDDSPAAPKVAVVSRTTWEKIQPGEAFDFGRQIFVKGQAFEVVGVVDNEFPNLDSMRDVDIWIPLKQNPMAWQYETDDYQEYQVLARLDPAKIHIAEQQLDAALADIEQRLGFLYTADVMSETDYRIHRSPQMHRLFTALFVVTGFLFILGTVNQALMLVTRSVAISSDLKVMAALGARTKHVLTRFIRGSASLMAISLLGVAVCSAAILQLYNRFWGATYGSIPLSRLLEPTPLLVLAAMVVFLVALHVSFPFFTYYFHGDSLLTRDRNAGSRFSMKNKLSIAGVVVQIALVTLCIFGCGAFLNSLQKKGSLEASAAEDRLLHVDVALGGMQEVGLVEAYTRFEQIKAALLQVGGVESVSTSNMLPFHTGGYTRVLVEGKPAEKEPDWISFSYVTPDYFDTVGVTILAGRDFLPAEATAWPPPSYIINQAYVDREFADVEALGRHIAPWDGVGFSPVVGVVENQYESIEGRTRPMIYIPIFRDRFFLHIRLADTALVRANAQLITDTITRTDSGAIVVGIEDIDTIWDEALASPQLGFTILLSLSLIGLLLALSGIYGYQSYIVALREREFAIRHAVGQSTSSIYWNEVKQGLSIALAGFLIGILCFYAGARAFAANLFSISLPPGSAVAISLILVGAFLAILLLASQATKSPKLAILMRE